MFDIVSVYHRDAAYEDWVALSVTIRSFETTVPFNLIGVDNRVRNVGFAKACNQGSKQGDAPFIGFLNPDAVVYGPFMQRVIEVFQDPTVVITGCRFGKPDRELKIWGVEDWVCGAAFFVRRDFWEQQDGFDERFVMYFEETDLIRRAQEAGVKVKSIDLPIHHESPTWDPPEDVVYKNKHFERSGRLFHKKWGRRP